MNKATDLENVDREREVSLHSIGKENAVEVEKKSIADVIRGRIAVEKTVAEEEEHIKDLRASAEAKRQKDVSSRSSSRCATRSARSRACGKARRALMTCGARSSAQAGAHGPGRADSHHHYVGEAQTLATEAEQNLLKLAEMRGRLGPDQQVRWRELKAEFVRLKRMGGGDDDPVTRVTCTLTGLSEQLDGIKQVLGQAFERTRDAGTLKTKSQTRMRRLIPGQPSSVLIWNGYTTSWSAWGSRASIYRFIHRPQRASKSSWLSRWPSSSGPSFPWSRPPPLICTIARSSGRNWRRW